MPEDNDTDVRAAVFALGLLEGEERAAFLRELENSENLQDEVELWQTRLAQLEIGRDALEPDPADWAMITQRLGFSSSGTRTAREREGVWIAYEPGIEIKYLQVDPTSAARTALLRMQAGAVASSHPHDQTEHCLVIEGDVTLDDHDLVKGDLHVAPVGTVHGSVRTKGGCLLLLRWDPNTTAAA